MNDRLKRYKEVSYLYWNEQYKKIGWPVVHNAGSKQKTIDLAEKEMDLFLYPTKEKCKSLIEDKENNPYPTFTSDFYKHPSIDELGINREKALDYGCGSLGRYTIALKKYFNYVYGLDVSSEAIRLAKKEVLERSVKGVYFILNDGLSIPYPSNFVDFIFSNLVLQHIGNKDANKQIAKEFVRVLKSGGAFRLEYLDSSSKKGDDFFSPVEGNGFTQDEIIQMYKPLGIEVICMTEEKPYLWVTGIKK